MPNRTRTFTIDELEEIGVPFDLADDIEVADEAVGSGRWNETRRILFRHDGDIWAVRYDVGLTEEQEVEPFHRAKEGMVTATAMEQREITVTKWMPIEDGS